MKAERYYRWLFLVAGLYDVVLGAAFCFLYVRIYDYFDIPLPNHPEYLQASAAFVVILGIMLLYVWKDMRRNFDMVKIAALSKLAYSGLTFYHARFTGIAPVFVIFAWCDLAFLILFVVFLCSARNGVIPSL